mmetsp:Transcript_35897/g.61244  ORF Transcript_35897/g.61244 Transcript_35897/m.61244 type:complete len:329 (+) Transcript_35897:337-1323(+)
MAYPINHQHSDFPEHHSSELFDNRALRPSHRHSIGDDSIVAADMNTDVVGFSEDSNVSANFQQMLLSVMDLDNDCMHIEHIQVQENQAYQNKPIHNRDESNLYSMEPFDTSLRLSYSLGVGDDNIVAADIQVNTNFEEPLEPSSVNVECIQVQEKELYQYAPSYSSNPIQQVTPATSQKQNKRSIRSYNCQLRSEPQLQRWGERWGERWGQSLGNMASGLAPKTCLRRRKVAVDTTTGSSLRQLDPLIVENSYGMKRNVHYSYDFEKFSQSMKRTEFSRRQLEMQRDLIGVSEPTQHNHHTPNLVTSAQQRLHQRMASTAEGSIVYHG